MIKPDLTKRFVPSDEDSVKYGVSLKKEDLQKTLLKFNESVSYSLNPGVPQYVLTTLSKYHDKDQSKLEIVDLFILYKSIQDIFSEGVGYLELKKFSKKHTLFFGSSQYELLKEFLENFN